MPNNDPWDLGGGGESFPFDRVGDAVEGYIIDVEDFQGTDLDTGEPAWWDRDRTRPVMLKRVTLQTTLKDSPADDGKRNVTLSGSKKPNPDGTMSKMAAALKAVKEATEGQTAFRFNAWFRMQFTSEGARTKPAFSPPKYYDAWYRSPVMELDGNDQTAPANQAGQWVEQVPPASFSGTATPSGNWQQGQNTTTTGANQGWVQQQMPEPAPGPISRNLAENLDLPDAQRYPAQQQPPARQPQYGPTPQEGAPVAQGGTLAGEPVTAAAVAAISKAGMNPDTVFGKGWQARVIG